MNGFNVGDTVKVVNHKNISSGPNHVHHLKIGSVHTVKETRLGDDRWGRLGAFTITERAGGGDNIYFADNFELVSSPKSELETWRREFPRLRSHVREVMKYDA